MVYVETLSNPMLRLADLPALAALAHAAGARAVVDATFTSPVNVRLDHVSGQLADLLHIDRCRFDPGDGHPVPASIDDDGIVSYNSHRIDVGRLGLPPIPRSHSWPEAAASFMAGSSSPPPPAS